MGIDAIQYAQDGTLTAPADPDGDWSEWVSASTTRSFVLDDPLLDWLKLYGEDKGFVPDDHLVAYDPRTDFTRFVLDQGLRFEAAVLSHLASLCPIVTIADELGDSHRLSKAQETFRAMQAGTPIIAQGVLWDADSRTSGAPDLLIRSDVLDGMFPGSIPEDEVEVSAPDLSGEPWHYRVIDIKFTNLVLLKNGDLNNSGSARAYKAQVFVYNRALGRLQGYLPPLSYLLGRSFTETVDGETIRGTSCMDRLGPVPHDCVFRFGVTLESRVDDASAWLRRVRSRGHLWEVLPEPSVRELYPNMSHTYDAPWSHAKKQIAAQLDELTLLWQVGFEKRNRAHDAGIRRWRDPRCTPPTLGVTGDTYPAILQAILDINREDGTDAALVSPSRVTSGEDVWRDTGRLEFFVDFETLNDLNDDFSTIPDKGGQPMIFMIGCGHIEDGVWTFESFTAAELVAPCEAAIIDRWLAHMGAVSRRLAPAAAPPHVFHWSHAETSTLVTAYNSAVERHPDKASAWTTPRWFDFLRNVMRAEPVVVRGSLGFGLKAIAQAMHAHGLISTNWETGPTDGLGAMVAAWSAAKESADQGIRLTDHPLMREVEAYNEVDCRVMLEIIEYLRQSH